MEEEVLLACWPQPGGCLSCRAALSLDCGVQTPVHDTHDFVVTL